MEMICTRVYPKGPYTFLKNQVNGDREHMAFPSVALYVHSVVRGTGDTAGSLYLRKEN